MTTSRRDVQQVLCVLDDMANLSGVAFADNTRDAFRIIDAVERLCRDRDRDRGTTGMAISNLKYRCRLCGTPFTAATVSDLASAIRAILRIGRLPTEPDLGKETEHHCGDGRIGVADLIGGESAG